MTAFDNVVAYMEGQGEATTANRPDLVSVMGADDGFLSLVVAPDIHSFDDLRGKELSVDAMTTGYAYVLRRMLAVDGLRYGDDYSLFKVGGMRERSAALLAGQHVATLSVPPFTFAAEDKGFRILAAANDVLDRYRGVVAAVRRAWAAEHADDIVAFIRANIAALGWLYIRSTGARRYGYFRPTCRTCRRRTRRYPVRRYSTTGLASSRTPKSMPLARKWSSTFAATMAYCKVCSPTPPNTATISTGIARSLEYYRARAFKAGVSIAGGAASFSVSFSRPAMNLASSGW